ncbi:unnamed protein product [Rotaria sp. Silwood1]|nr:unnamed protein product [Rotaria sp. Silwood1]
MISNVGGSLQSDKCKVIVSKSPVFVVKPTAQKVKQSATAVFVTTIDGYPTPTVTWLLNGKLLTAKKGVQVQFDATTGQARLFVENVDLEQHAGSITCRLENPHGNQEETVRLDVLAAPIITKELPKEQEIVSGRDVTLKVIVRGSPRPSAQWFFKDRAIKPENVSVDEANNEYQLMIKQASVVRSEGTYRVVLMNEVGEVESTPCTLTVREPVKLTKVKPASDAIDLQEGKAFDIVVNVSGKETPKVQLTKDGKAVPLISEGTTRYTFSVTNVKREDQGIYKVTAKNKTSTEEITVTLNITGEFACISKTNFAA